MLFTCAPVRHAAVTSERLGLTSRRIGLVGLQHALADAGSVEVADYLEQRMIFNPSVPVEWMSPFWLGDIRSRRDAQLVAVDAQDHAAVIQQMARTGTVTVSLELCAALLGPHLRSVTLNGAPAVPFYAARRRDDRRGHVLALVDSLLSVCSRRSERNTVSCLEPQVVTGGSVTQRSPQQGRLVAESS